MIDAVMTTKNVVCRALFLSASFALLAILGFSGMAFGQSPPTENSPAAGPSRMSLDQMPPQLPTVTFRNGELTIVAYNSSLRDILDMVRKQTGAAIDIPEEATERVFVNLGPGPARRVLDSLLAGSSFNYVMLGSETDPQALTKVLLSSKPSGSIDSPSVVETPLATHRPSPVIAQRQLSPSEEVEEPTAPIQVASEPAKPPASSADAAQKQENATKTEIAGKADTTEKTETAADVSSQAAADNQSPADYPRTPNIRTAQEVLQDLYARRQAMQQQHQSSPQ